MKARKIVTIVVNVVAGSVVVFVGLGMLPFPLNLAWGFFNAWIWIAGPISLLWAKKNEDEMKTLSAS